MIEECLLGLSEDCDKKRSTLIMALRGARHLTGRDLLTGVPKDEKSGANLESDMVWEAGYGPTVLIGLVFYLILLETLGSLFVRKKSSKSENLGDGITHALSNFSNPKLGTDEIKGIEALRNCLAHKFSLGNDTHIFSLSTEFNQLIELPKNEDKWHGKLDKKEKYYTKINEVKMCQLVEDVFAKMVGEFEIGNLIVKKKHRKSMEVLKAKYTILYT
ncbi:MAG: hypothetical protein JKX84_06375 [Flavobacteriales bacterium]|nr:hypothetical protein [Flavobacteriales bacterium]